MDLEPNLNNGGRWHHIASEAELMKAVRFGKDCAYYEIPQLGMTYIVCRDYLTTVRCGGMMGGDTRDIEGGWVYDNPFSQYIEEMEIAKLAQSPINKLI